MSASFDKVSKIEYLYKGPNKLSPKEEAVIFCRFDTDVDRDLQIYNSLKRERKTYTQFCMFKLLNFIPEYITSYFLFGKEIANERKDNVKKCISFLRNKMSMEDFRKYFLGLK